MCVGGLQASVNPKAETVEELKGRRKALHLGMCKLLREDLALKAEHWQRLAYRRADADASGIRDRVVKEFDQLMRAHEDVAADAFNSDERYKALMTEAIDGKAHALLKLDVYLESIATGADRAALNRIRDAALAQFADPSLVLPLRTGVTEFPWAAVVKDKKPEIDLGGWDAGPVAPQAREAVMEALGSNGNIRVVTVKGSKLVLSEGCATTRLEWAGQIQEALQAVPATVALILRSCWGPTSLDLRCNRSGWAS